MARARNRIRRILSGTMACAMCLGMLGGGALSTASAADGTAGSPGTVLKKATTKDYTKYYFLGDPFWLGVVGTDADGTRYYCADHGTFSDFTLGEATQVPDTDGSRQVAALLRKYQHEPNTPGWTQSALAVIVHDRYDTKTGPRGWSTVRPLLAEKFPYVFERAGLLLEEAPSLVPERLQVSLSYDEAYGTGTVSARVDNAQGEALDGIGFELRLEGDAVFEDGQAVVTGTSTADASVFRWRATGEGTVRVRGLVSMPSLELVLSSQNLVRLGPGLLTGSAELEMPVLAEFTPVITTETPRTLQPGSTVTDEVTVSLGTDDPWPADVALDARGWYFDGLDDAVFADPVVIDGDAGAEQALAGLAARGIVPSGYAAARFTSERRTVTVTAMQSPDGGGEYHARACSGFGTWMWAILREDQADERIRSAMRADVVTGFLEPSETNVTKAQPAVSSETASHAGIVGDELSDTITVSGMPADHGVHEGSQDHGLAPDRSYAQVTLWWSGSGDGTDDAPYRPDGREEPAGEDAHHRIVGTWDVPARNGQLTVGNGMPDAHGNPVTIPATQAGWYVFVWKFAGDSRVRAAASDYGDPLERVLVRELPSRAAVPSAPAATAETPAAAPPAEAGAMPMATTGASVGMAVAVLCAALLLGCAMAAIRRRMGE